MQTRRGIFFFFFFSSEIDFPQGCTWVDSTTFCCWSSGGCFSGYAPRLSTTTTTHKPNRRICLAEFPFARPPGLFLFSLSLSQRHSSLHRAPLPSHVCRYVPEPPSVSKRRAVGCLVSRLCLSACPIRAHTPNHNAASWRSHDSRPSATLGLAGKRLGQREIGALTKSGGVWGKESPREKHEEEHQTEMPQFNSIRFNSDIHTIDTT